MIDAKAKPVTEWQIRNLVQVSWLDEEVSTFTELKVWFPRREVANDKRPRPYRRDGRSLRYDARMDRFTHDECDDT